MRRTLTDKQRQQVAETVRLADFLAWKAWRRSPEFMEIDELKDAAYEGLIIAATSNDETKGKFASYAGIKIKWQILDAKRIKVRKPHEVSLDAIPDIGDNLLSTIQAPTIDIDTRIMIEQEISKLDEREGTALRMILSGHTLKEVGERMGVTKEYARQIADRAKRAIRQNIKKEDVIF